MADSSVKVVQELLKASKDIAKKCYPAYDEILNFALSRQHLDLQTISDIIIDTAKNQDAHNLQEHLRNDVRLIKIDEISHDKGEKIHLPGVESAITSMRGRSFSLLFIVQGDSIKTSIYLGLSRFADADTDINAALESYSAAWLSNFPGSKLQNLTTKESSDVSFYLADCNEFGVLTGIPSLKRKEDSDIFVQGIERLIRAMRGKTYCWISIADPVSNIELNNAIEACQNLQSEIHHLVTTDLSKATSNGKTVMFGMFGMMGQGETTGQADTVNSVETHGSSEASTHSVGGSVGASFFAHVSADYHYSKMHGTMESVAKGVANTLSNAISKQLGGGAFSSLGMTWTKTTTVGQELLNRKMEYAEEILKKYEERLHTGTAIGMWNLGNYFCAADVNTYNQGIGIVTSLFMGMDSTHEPPRAIKMPTEFRDILRNFNNIYLHFENIHESGNKSFTNHPLGFIFNGPSTPVNTKELAIATPFATQDVEGVSVSRRPAFGINLNIGMDNKNKTLTIGRILDKGNQTNQSYRILQANLPKHLAVFGLTGSGKTNTVHHLLWQLWKNDHIPFLVIEPAKAEYRALATMDEFKDDLLVISAGIDRTTACPLRLNPFDFEPGSDTDANRVHVLTHIDRLKATFNASFPMYASMPYILEEAILEVYQERGWNLGRSENRFVDIYNHDFRDYLPTLRDLYWKVDDVVKRKGYFQEQQMNIQAALKARLSSLLVGAKGTMLDTARSLPSKDLFERPVVIELENLGDDDEKAFLMGLLVSRLYEWRKATFTNIPNHPLRHVLVVEEAHRLLANIPDTSANMEVGNSRGKAVASFVDMLSEIRSYGEGVIVVDQLPSRVSPNIVKGTGTKIVHRLLANDDRESVGGTMGLTDEQIADMSLLRTGECIISQDGDLKAFQVLVPKSETHEKRVGGEISTATKDYRCNNAGYFAMPSADIDLEDVVFKDSLYKTMLAIGFGQSSSSVFDLRPTHPCGKWSERAEWFSVYWKQVCAEIWSEHGGNWAAWLALRNAGIELLQNGTKAEKEYRLKFKDYFMQSRLYVSSVTGELIGIAFEPFFVNGRTSILESVNRNWDMMKNAANRAEHLAEAIRRVLPLLEPKGIHFDKSIRSTIVSEIVNRINPTFTAEILTEFQKGEA